MSGNVPDKSDTPPLSCHSSSDELLGEASASIQPSQQQILGKWQWLFILFPWPFYCCIDLNHCSDFTQKSCWNACTKSQPANTRISRLSPSCTVHKDTGSMAKAGPKNPLFGVLRVHYSGEAGIDTGAMSQRILSTSYYWHGEGVFPRS